MREEALSEAANEHGGPFKSLRRMHRDQCHALTLIFNGVLVGNECGLFNESIQRIKRLEIKEASRDATQLKQVRPTLLPVNPFVGQVGT